MTETASTGAALPLFTRLGHCEIRQLLGQGGGGISYLAYDENLEREVVIKEHFPPSLCYRLPGTAAVQPVSAADYERSLALFCREARILAGLNHPGIVKVHDIFQAAGTAYMVMEYVEGERLTEWLPAHGREVQLVTGVLDSLLAALAYLHSHEVLHRDIKPSNIIIRRGEEPVLLDFGAAMIGTPLTTITLVGTPGYAAPEQFEKHGRIGPWSDLYALAHSFTRHITARQLRKYPRRFVKALHRAALQDWSLRPAGAEEWRQMLKKNNMLMYVLFGLLFLGVAAFIASLLQRSDKPAVEAAPAAISGASGVSAASVYQTPSGTDYSQLDKATPEQLKKQMLELRRQQNAKLQKFADQMNTLLPPDKRDRGWVILPGQGDIAEQAQQP